MDPYLQASVLLLQGLHRRWAAATGISCHRGRLLLHPALELGCYLLKAADLMGHGQVLREEGGPALARVLSPWRCNLPGHFLLNKEVHGAW